MRDERIGGERARHATRFEQPELLALVTAGVDAPEKTVIGRRAAQERDLLGVIAEDPRGRRIVERQSPYLRKPGAAQMEQGPAVARENRCGGSADGGQVGRCGHEGSLSCGRISRTGGPSARQAR